MQKIEWLYVYNGSFLIGSRGWCLVFVCECSAEFKIAYLIQLKMRAFKEAVKTSPKNDADLVAVGSSCHVFILVQQLLPLIWKRGSEIYGWQRQNERFALFNSLDKEGLLVLHGILRRNWQETPSFAGYTRVCYLGICFLSYGHLQSITISQRLLAWSRFPFIPSWNLAEKSLWATANFLAPV